MSDVGGDEKGEGEHVVIVMIVVVVVMVMIGVVGVMGGFMLRVSGFTFHVLF